MNMNLTNFQEFSKEEKKSKQPITLEQIQEWVKNEQFDKFYLSSEIEEKYQVEKEEAIQKLKKKLKLKRAQNKHLRWVVQKNDYPYYLATDLEHWIIWDIKQKDWNKTKLDFYGQIRKCDNYHDHASVLAQFSMANQVNWWEREYWINPPQFRSISDIPHIHLVKKNRSKQKL